MPKPYTLPQPGLDFNPLEEYLRDQLVIFLETADKDQWTPELKQILEGLSDGYDKVPVDVRMDVIDPIYENLRDFVDIFQQRLTPFIGKAKVSNFVEPLDDDVPF